MKRRKKQRRTRPKKTCRVPRRRPYGHRGTEPYCNPHDMCWTYSVSKKGARQKAKRAIKKEQDDGISS